MKKQILPIVLGAIVLTGISFYGGMSYQKHVTPTSFAGRYGAGATMARPTGMGRAGMNGGFIGGEVLSIDDKSVTIKLPDGGSRIVFLSDTTEVMKSTSGTVSDLAVGTQVTANGKTNTDGSMTASTIQIRPMAQAAVPTTTPTTPPTTE